MTGRASASRWTKGYVKAVLTSFVHLYDKGLIYRGKRIINWCPSCETAISDLEVEHEERAGQVVAFALPLRGGRRAASWSPPPDPETMLGDTAVAVNPDDARYTGLVGKHGDAAADESSHSHHRRRLRRPAFGTGAVKVTPAHDPNDAEMGRRHNLPAPMVIGKRRPR